MTAPVKEAEAVAEVAPEVGPTNTATVRPPRRIVSPQAQQKASQEVSDPSIPTTINALSGLLEPSRKWCCGLESISLWCPMNFSGSRPLMTEVMGFAGPRPVAGGA